MFVEGRGEEPVAMTRTCSTGSTGSLGCRGFGNPVDLERLDATVDII